MSNQVLSAQGVAERYKTHRSQLMTLWVTRQGQNFVTSGDLQLCDVELINASVHLVGEPALGNNGNILSEVNPHKATNNDLHTVNDQGTTSTVYGITAENRVLTKTHLDHRFLNISIEGMTKGHQFRKDFFQAGNDLELVVPTDYGLIVNRNDNWPPTPLLLENVHLEQNLRVDCVFAGTWPARKKVARFTEDWADAPDPGGNLRRNADGTVRYFFGDDESPTSTTECQVPANCIDSIRLVFKITPRTEL